jgi:PTS system cellobiose-specific IIB component
MMNILLCCAAGMSTSLLVRKMNQTSSEQGENNKIWAVPGDVVYKHIKDADVILLGPQVRHLLPELQKLGQEKGIPVDIINTVHYGTCNGVEVLKHAKQLQAK